MRAKLWTVVLVLLLVGMLFSSCAPSPAPTSAPAPAVQPTQPPVVVTQIVEKPITVTQVVTQPVVAQPTPVKPVGTLTLALSASPNSIDMPLASEREAQNASWPMFDSLVWLNDQGKVVPALATSWDISPDGKAYTFHLRQGVSFSNGEPFTADSVIASWKHGQSKGMHWVEKWSVVTDVQKVNDYTVKLVLSAPNVLLLRIIAQFWAMIPPKYLAQVGDDGFSAKPIGTGPFVLQEWVKDDRIVYKANPNYWVPGEPKVDTLIFRPVPDESTRIAAVQTGEVDVAPRLTSDEAQSLLGAPNLRIVKYTVDREFYIAFNNMTSGKGQPTEDVRVRQAMNYAVDRAAIIKSLFGGYGNLSTGLIAPNDMGYDASIKPYPYDPAKAKQLLSDAGFPNGFSMDFACPSGAYTHFEEVCQAVQEYLKKVGITTNLDIEESGHYWDLEGQKQLPPLFGDSWAETSGEAYPRLQGALGGKDAAFSSWTDPKILAYLAQIASTVDDTQRAAVYGQLKKYMYDNPPFIYLYEPVTFEAVNNRVQAYAPRAAEEYYLKDTWALTQ